MLNRLLNMSKFGAICGLALSAIGAVCAAGYVVASILCAALLGYCTVMALYRFYPALLNNFFQRQCWFEFIPLHRELWLDFLSETLSGMLPGLAAGWLLGFLLTLPVVSPSLLSVYLTVTVFNCSVLLCAAAMQEDLPEGCSTTVMAYRVDDRMSPVDTAQSKEWTDFLESEMSVFTGESSINPKDTEYLSGRFGGELHLTPGEQVFVMVKDYWMPDHQWVGVRQILRGYQTTESLREAFRQVARDRHFA